MDGSETFNNTFQYIGFETAEELETIGDLTTHTFFFGILFQTDVSGQPGPLGVSGHQVRAPIQSFILPIRVIGALHDPISGCISSERRRWR